MTWGARYGRAVRKIGSIEARENADRFAERFDPLPAHLSGQPNELLPARSVSGFWVMCEAVNLAVSAEADRIICGTDMSAQWRLPVIAGDRLDVYLLAEPLSPRAQRTKIEVRRLDKVVAIFTITHRIRG